MMVAGEVTEPAASDPRREARLEAELEAVLVDPRRGVHEDERLVFELHEVDRAGLRQGMHVAEADHEVVGGIGDAADVLEAWAGRVIDHVELARYLRGHGLLAGGERDEDARVRGHEAGDTLDGLRLRAEHADVDGAFDVGLHAAYRRVGLGQPSQDALDAAQVHAPPVVEQDAPAHAVEKRGPELFLQFGDGARERRLRHMERLGRLRDTFEFCDLRKIPQLVKFHGARSSHGAICVTA